jgi:hypothetical protein
MSRCNVAVFNSDNTRSVTTGSVVSISMHKSPKTIARGCMILGEANTEFPNLPQIAGLYSQLAGVLAGFAFATLTALVIAQVTSGSTTNQTLGSFMPFLGTFIGLVLSSLNYAIIAGEIVGTPRVADLQTVAGVGFATAGLMLFYSILVLLRGLEKDAPTSRAISERAAKLTRGIVGGMVPFLTALLYSGLRDHLDAAYGRIQSQLHWTDIVSWTIILLSSVGSVLIAFKYYDGQNHSIQPVRRITIAAVCISFISLLGVSLLTTVVGPDTAIPDFVPLILLASFAAFASAVHGSAATYRAYE